MIVVLSGLGRTPLWEPYDAIYDPGPIGVREAHHALAAHAAETGWDQTVLIVQDDVEQVPITEHHGEITVYTPTATGQWGWLRYPDHVCPRVFTATPKGWGELVEVWSRHGKTCELWTPDYVAVGPADVVPGKERNSLRRKRGRLHER